MTDYNYIFVNGLIIYLEIFLTNLGGISSWPHNLFSLSLCISSFTFIFFYVTNVLDVRASFFSLLPK